MKIMKITVNTLITFTCLALCGCSNVDQITEDQNVETETLELRSANGHIFYLVHAKKAKIASSQIVGLFLSGWQFQNDVTISGYTATDDLWTVVSQVSKKSDFDLIKIELTGVKYKSKEWYDCVGDICNKAHEIDQIIVLDQDLETELMCTD